MPVAFFVDSIDLLDPAVSTKPVCLTCSAMNDAVGALLGIRLGNRTMSLVQLFRPLDTSAPTVPSELYMKAKCVDSDGDGDTDWCGPDGTPIMGTSTNHVGDGQVCDAIVPNSMKPGPLAEANIPGDPCVISSVMPTLQIEVALDANAPPECTLTFIDAMVAGEYDDPVAPSVLRNSLFRAFLSDDNAKACTIDNTLLCGGPQTLYDILYNSGAGDCGDNTDRDTHKGKDGWWFYANVTAKRVEWRE